MTSSTSNVQVTRPTDVIGNAVRVAQILTGEAEEEYVEKPAKFKLRHYPRARRLDVGYARVLAS
jgi:hypothetical protein